MPWHLTEFLLKGIYLGLLVALALRGPSWLDVAIAGLCMLGGLVGSLGSVAVRMLREGYRATGRWFGFILFLLLENPGKVYAGLIAGLAVGILLPTAISSTEADVAQNQSWLMLAAVAGGAALGLLFWAFRRVRQSKIRKWLGLGLAVIFMTAAAVLFFCVPELLKPQERIMLGSLLLLGIPGFYLLTFASLSEESEVEIAAMCGTMGAGLWLVLSSLGNMPFQAGALIVPLAIYFVYTWRILPGVRVFKHALRGLSFARVGEYRLALASLNRALQLDPRHALAREQMWYVHRQMDVEQLKADPETLALVNFDLCLERSAALLLIDKPTPEQLDEAEKLLRLVADQRPDLEPTSAYWRAVAALRRRHYEAAAKDLESVLSGAARGSALASDGPGAKPQAASILFQAWQLALVLHPEMKVRVATPLLQQPGRRMEAIAVVERRLAGSAEDSAPWDLKRPGQPGRTASCSAKADNSDAWDLKRLLYSDLTEPDYDAFLSNQPEAQATGPAPDFDHAYVQQLGLALIDNPQRWQRGCEFLRLAARGLPTAAPTIYIQIGKVHEQHGDHDGMRQNFQKAMQRARSAGIANLKAEDQEALFAAVKQLGEQAMAEKRIDEALDAFKFYSQFERSGLETYRILADLFERKGNELAQQAADLDVKPRGESSSPAGNDMGRAELLKESQQNIWLALHCTEHALSYDGKDRDLLARKDRYYYSIQPADVKERWENVRLWFDVDYCLEKARWLLDRNNEDLWDWASHLAELAHSAHPGSIAVRVLLGRLCRLRGDTPGAIVLLEEVRQHKPEKFVNETEEQSWFIAHRLLGDLYLADKPDQALQCFQEFRKSDKAGADTLYKMGRAFESLGDLTRAARCYEQVAAFEKHPLYYEAREALERVKRNPPT